MFDNDVYSKMIVEKLAVGMTEINAAQLYNDWYLGGGTVFGKSIPCTDVRIYGPDHLMPKENEPEGVCPNMSAEACKLAREKLATWDADFEWTTGQHEVGAQFAAKNCKKKKPGEDIYENACDALKSAPAKPTKAVE